MPKGAKLSERLKSLSAFCPNLESVYSHFICPESRKIEENGFNAVYICLVWTTRWKIHSDAKSFLRLSTLTQFLFSRGEKCNFWRLLEFPPHFYIHTHTLLCSFIDYCSFVVYLNLFFSLVREHYFSKFYFNFPSPEIKWLVYFRFSRRESRRISALSIPSEAFAQEDWKRVLSL